MASPDDQRPDRRLAGEPREFTQGDSSSDADQAGRETPPEARVSPIAGQEASGGAVRERVGDIPPTTLGQRAVPDTGTAEPPLKEFGKFRLLERIGVGGMGEVYRAVQPGTNRTIALKLIDLGSSRQARERFLDEIRVVAGLQHENIITVLEGGEFDGQPYCAMELVDGQDLSDIIGGQPLAKERVVEYGKRMAAAIEHAHRAGIVHRDLKPSNVLVDRNDLVRVADFGLAKRLDDSTGLTVAGQILGTPAYMSPEQARGDPNIDHRADVYGMGAVIYEMLTGRPPFRAATHAATLQQVIGEFVVTPRRLNPAADRELETICLKCLEKEPLRRYQTAQEILGELQRVEQGVPIQARPTTSIERAARWAKRHPLTAALGGAVAVLLLATGIVSAVAFAIAGRSREEVQQQQRITQHARREEQAARQTAETAAEMEAVARRAAEAAAQREAEAKKRAEQATLEEARAQQVADQRRQGILRSTAQLAVQNGMQEAEQSNCAAAVVWFAEALRTVEELPDDHLDHRMRIANYRRFVPQMESMIVHRAAVRVLAVSADGGLVAMADGHVHVWDRATSKLIWKFRAVDYHLPTGAAADTPDQICRIQFAGGGRWLVLFSVVHRRLPGSRPQFDRVSRVRLLDVEAQQPQTPWLECPTDCNVVAASPEGRWLAAALAMPSPLPGEESSIRPGRLHAWSFDGETVPASDEHMKALQAEKQCDDAVWQQKITPESSIVVSFASFGNAHLAHADTVLTVQTTASRDLWVTGSEDRTARLWTRPEAGPIDGRAPIYANVRLNRDPTAEIETDGLVFACDSAAMLTRIRSPSSGRLVGVVPTISTDIERAVFLRNGEDLLLANLGQVFLCDLRSGQLRAATPELDGAIRDVAVSADESLVATATRDGSVRLWTVEGIKPRGDPMLHPERVNHVDFHPQGARLVTACADGAARQWTIAQATPFGKAVSGSGEMLRAWYTPDGRSIVTVNEEDGVRLWDAETSQPQGGLRSSGDDVHRLAVRPDRSAVYWVAFLDESLRVSRLAPQEVSARPQRPSGDGFSGQPRDSANGPQNAHHDGEITSITVSPNGRFVATASADGTARIWNADTLAAHGPPLQHADYVAAVAFSPDSRYVATASWDSTARVWSLATGQPLTPPLPHDGHVRSVQFSPDGQTLVTIDLAMTRFWDISPDSRAVNEIVSDAQWQASRLIDANGQLTPPDSAQFIMNLRQRFGTRRGMDPYWVDLRQRIR